MLMRAKVSCTYGRESISNAIAVALIPDSHQAPKGIQVATDARGTRVVSTIKLDGKIETLLATLDDLLACTSTAESIL
ncbi:MAG: KEOPS complex subunit Pcc1 [Candidatus Hadarchaeaceae archaeon]|nr:MAG: hypothetical protein AVW05_02505 [Hadesarchaea archaeon DG-33]